MFQGLDSRKKRRSSDSQSSVSSATRRRLVTVNGSKRESASNVDTSPPPLIFSGLLICLSGLVAEEKVRLHRMVEQLGGRFARDLDTDRTTHLIAQVAQGAKYDTATACPSISVVTPKWLIDSFSERKQLDEAGYPLVPEAAGVKEEQQSEAPLGGMLAHILEQRERNKMFYSCRFLLLGFDIDSKEVQQLEKLLRRGEGTIYRELNETITHILIQDDCDQILM